MGAAEFVPGTGGIDRGVQGGGVVESKTLSTEDHHLIQPQPLEVGRATVGPGMSEIYETAYVDDGFDWSMGTSSLAVLPHRYT